jgi:hypothetical protein
MEDAATEQSKRGKVGNARILGEGAVQKSIAKVGGYIDFAKNAISTLFSGKGIGGMAVTVGMIGVGIAAHVISDKIMSKKRKKEVLYSPEVLGGIDYDKKVVNDQMFEDILAQETGITSLDGLYDAIRITDAINLHRNAKFVAKYGINDIDTIATMQGLGYSDTSKYADLKLQDIFGKMGYKGDWKDGLNKATLKKGIDYDTSWTRFVRGMTTYSHYMSDESERLFNEGLITQSQYRDRNQKAYQYWVDTDRRLAGINNVGSLQPG